MTLTSILHFVNKTTTQFPLLCNDKSAGLKVGKISAGMVALPSFPSTPQASTILATDRCKHQRPVA